MDSGLTENALFEKLNLFEKRERLLKKYKNQKYDIWEKASGVVPIFALISTPLGLIHGAVWSYVLTKDFLMQIELPITFGTIIAVSAFATTFILNDDLRKLSKKKAKIKAIDASIGL